MKYVSELNIPIKICVNMLYAMLYTDILHI